MVRTLSYFERGRTWCEVQFEQVIRDITSLESDTRCGETSSMLKSNLEVLERLKEALNSFSGEALRHRQENEVKDRLIVSEVQKRKNAVKDELRYYAAARASESSLKSAEKLLGAAEAARDHACAQVKDRDTRLKRQRPFVSAIKKIANDKSMLRRASLCFHPDKVPPDCQDCSTTVFNYLREIRTDV